MNVTRNSLKELIREELITVLEEDKDPKAKVRNRGDVIFPADSSSVSDNKDHFPINNIDQARNALSRASQYKTKPSWYDGSLDSLVKKIQSRVKEKYSSIDTTEASAEPGKN